MNVNTPSFDFLVKLYAEDPEALEHYRKHLLREALNAAPPKQRATLEQLLLRIESARAQARDPADAARIAFGMMCTSLDRLQGAWGQTRCAVARLQTSLLIERVRR
jgi:hypothetical protein